MIGGHRVLAVIPARGGSKGIPRKNLQKLRGVPLVGHACRCAAAVAAIDRTVVSTDDDEIAQVAESYGGEARFRRPVDLADDRVPDHPVLLHAVENAEALDGLTYDLVVMLQPTSPGRRPGHVTAALEMAASGSWDAVWTVSPTDSKYHPDKQLSVDDDRRLDYYSKRGASIVARQQLSPMYHRNGVAYVLTRECLMGQRTIKGRRTGALVLDDPSIVNIDTAWDLRLAEFVLSELERH